MPKNCKKTSDNRKRISVDGIGSAITEINGYEWILKVNLKDIPLNMCISEFVIHLMQEGIETDKPLTE